MGGVSPGTVRTNGTKSSRFTHLHLENWRNFQLVDVDLRSRAFLVGPNASGKSNFLNVFRFLHDVVRVGGGFESAVEGRGGVPRLRCLAARGNSDIAIRVRVGGDAELASWEYELRFSQERQSQQPVIRAERVLKMGQVLVDRPDPADRADSKLLTQTHLQQVTANRKFRELVEFFDSVRYLHIVPQLVREPDRSVGKQNDPYGGDFLEQVALASDKARRGRLNRIKSALRVAVPQLADLELRRDAKGRPHLRGKYEHWRPQGAWQSEGDFSDGTLRLMGLLWATLDQGGPLLLEEPELSLHPELVRFLPQMLARVQRRTGCQVILSTHSPQLLQDDGIGLDEVLLLMPSREGTEVRPAGYFGEIKTLLEGGSTLAEAVMPRTSPVDAGQLPLFGE